MKNLAGILLLASGHAISALTIVAAFSYLCFFVLWMHAPLLDVLQLTTLVALWPLGLAWLCGRLGKHLRNITPVIPSSPAARWLLACAAVVMLGSGVKAAHTALRHYECRMDPSRSAAEREAQIRQDGFERVCEGALARYDIAFGALGGATRKLAFTPVDLTHTPFAALEPLGGSVEYISEVPSHLYRGFRTADGHRLTLSEHDMSADGSRAWRHPKDEPERIKGMPARLIVLEAPSGAAISHLSWFEGRRAYELWIDANVIRTPLRERLFALAASLPASVPGCPNEVPPKPVQVGADGFPVDEHMPAVITRDEMDAMTGRSKRPCK